MSRLRWAGLPAEQLTSIAWELYRQKHGLEARAVVGMAISPQDALEAVRASLTPRHFLTAPYVAAVVLLLDPETPASVLGRLRADLAARPYIPPAEDAENWRAELAWCVAELVARRALWDERRQEQTKSRAKASQRRKARISAAALGPAGSRRMSRRALRALAKFYMAGTMPPPEVVDELRRFRLDRTKSSVPGAGDAVLGS